MRKLAILWTLLVAAAGCSVNERGEATCEIGIEEPCYDGPVGTAGVGLCIEGTRRCGDDGEWMECAGQVLPAEETCNGLDDDCDGDVDNGIDCECLPGESQSCYGGPAGSAGVGLCLEGTQECDEEGRWGECEGWVAPVEETCNGLDDDCDGLSDELDDCECEPGDTMECYEGSPETRGRGLCRAGVQTCGEDYRWSGCEGQVLPAAEVCDGADNDCNGAIDDAPGCECEPGETQDCYDGPPETRDRGLCLSGTQTCGEDYRWGRCQDQVLPAADICDGQDNDCDGAIDEGLRCECDPGEVQDCYSGPAGTADVGRCVSGSQLCGPDSTWGRCEGEVLPLGEDCNGIDDDCDGRADEDFDLNTDPRHCGACGARCVTPNAHPACSEGECRVGSCLAGFWDNDGEVENGCEHPCTFRGAEVCNGIDDDCDEDIDEDYDVGEECDGVGACGAGTIECRSPLEAICSTDPGGSEYDGVPEICDGLDNDCDGRTDEDFASLGTDCEVGVGECRRAGTRICADDGLRTVCGAVPGDPVDEACDGLDNDCDELIDEECTLASTAWPTYQFDRRRTGHNLDVAGPDTAEVLWSYELGGGTIASPVVGEGGEIYVAANESLFAFDPEGELLWEFDLGDTVDVSGPTLQSDGAIYVGGGRTLFCVEPGGEERWSRETDGFFRSGVGARGVLSPVIASNGDVYVPVGDLLMALRPDGTLLWTFYAGGNVLAPAVGSDRRIYVAATNGTVYAVNPDGSLEAEYLVAGSDIDGGLAIGQDGTVYMPVGGVIHALSRGLASVRWTYRAPADIDSNLGIMNTRFECCTPRDYIYTSPNGNTGLVQVRYDGVRQWQTVFPKHGSNNGGPVFDDDGDAYVGSSDGRFYAIRRDGSVKWSIEVGGDNQTPALDDDRVYFISLDGFLHAIGPVE